MGGEDGTDDTEDRMIKGRRFSLWRICGVVLVLCFQVYAEEITVLRNSENWMYTESRPGLRQEDHPVPVWGELFYQRNALPVSMQKDGVSITTDIGTFRY